MAGLLSQKGKQKEGFKGCNRALEMPGQSVNPWEKWRLLEEETGK